MWICYYNVKHSVSGKMFDLPVRFLALISNSTLFISISDKNHFYRKTGCTVNLKVFMLVCSHVVKLFRGYQSFGCFLCPRLFDNTCSLMQFWRHYGLTDCWWSFILWGSTYINICLFCAKWETCKNISTCSTCFRLSQNRKFCLCMSV